MDRINVDAATAAALLAAKPGAELVGQDGHQVGVFLPARMAGEIRWYLEERTRRYQEAFEAVSEAELIAACEAGGAIPHDEVVRRLGLQ